ncbi:TAXI family TRAP transporter solute-binding subunit [Acuticoccus kandeliae]|uniref:TAXI family TRAP transporter solute-binding subunit n=1 Tax=Acuticoccus kandeliae TaxID=2073160 RepID=UPI000D3E3E45|nr:TAXI family TRAP transporter solute-binding subunit [Acuticoccus kandeliae]
MRKLLCNAALVGALMVGTAAAHADEKVIGTIGIAGDTFQLATAWSNHLAKSGASVSLTPVDGGGTNSLLRMVATDRADLGFIGSPHFKDAMEGNGAFEKEPEQLLERYKTMNVLFGIPTGMAQYVTRADSGIESFQDLKGKSVGFGRPGGNAGRISGILFRANGLDPEAGAVDGRYVEAGTAFDQLSNNQLDATIVWGGVPQSGLYNVARSHDVRFLSPDPATFEQFKSEVTNGDFYVFREFTPEQLSEAYGGHATADGPVYFWTFPMMVVVNADISEDEAYELTKAVWDNIDAIRENNTQLGLMSIDNALEGLSAPLHPGAARYFQEKGVEVPD